MSRFLRCLKEQTNQSFHLVIVDQNNDDRLVEIVDLYRQFFEILHVRSEPGLSRARNLGIQHIKGELVAFPDDDCWYPKNLLEQVSMKFKNTPDIDGVSGMCIDENGVKSLNEWADKSTILSRENVWKNASSPTIFLSSDLVKSVGCFDESLGLGSGTIWGSGEETDYLIRAIDNKWRIQYIPEIVIGHPNPVLNFDSKTCERAYSYGAGLTRVLHKHHFPFATVIRYLLRPAIASAFFFIIGRRNKSKFYRSSLAGRIRGLKG